MRISDWSSDVCSSDLFGSTGSVRTRAPLSVEPHLAVSRASARQHRRNGHGPDAQGNRPRRGREPPGGVHRMTTDIIIYHNPECGTSRNTLAMIRNAGLRSEEHTSELQSLMRHSYAVFCL